MLPFLQAHSNSSLSACCLLLPKSSLAIFHNSSGLGSNLTSWEKPLFLTSHPLFLHPALFVFLPLITTKVILFVYCLSPSTKISAVFTAEFQAVPTMSGVIEGTKYTFVELIKKLMNVPGRHG